MRFEGILLDYSKNLIDETTIKLLLKLAAESNLSEWRERIFSGEKINHTEERAVLHTALRTPKTDKLIVDGENIIPQVHSVLEQMEGFVEKIHSGEWQGFSGKRITDIINIGIGGSDLGPRMVVNALHPWQSPNITSHFVSNLDGRELSDTLERVEPSTTLFLIASKTFTTLETMTNATTARNWFLQQSGSSEDAISNHFAAISTNIDECLKFGIARDSIFHFWDWVGGRYSLWSAIGLSIAVSLGMKQFRKLLAGAHAMDNHFREAPLAENMPLILALLGVWNRNFSTIESLAILPYESSLNLFPSYLQQLDMESNGKQVDRAGDSVKHQTSSLLWGESGSNGQHSFFQFLHQSQTRVAIDFIGTINPEHKLKGHHHKLTANMLAQSEALMGGRSIEQAQQGLATTDLPSSKQQLLAPYKTFPGNTPSNMLLLDRLDPYTLGSLIALYEHKVFAQGVIWNINSFDQMGVELGKELAKEVQYELESGNGARKNQHDDSTRNLINIFLERRVSRH